MEQEIKARSFRITDATSEKIKNLAGEIGGNQQEVIAKLIEAYEFQKGKAVLSDKQGEIESFEKYTAILTRMFMGSLEDNQNLTATIRIEFESLLDSKDHTIRNLQEENKDLKQEKTVATADLKLVQEESEDMRQKLNAAYQEEKEKKTTFESMLKDKEELNQALTITVSEQRDKIDGMKKMLSEAEKIKKSYQELENRLNVADTAVKEAKQRLETEMQKAELDAEKKLLELDKAHQKELQKIKSENQKEIDQYQKKYLELLEKMQKEEKKDINKI